jgi:hypothetical protein
MEPAGSFGKIPDPAPGQSTGSRGTISRSATVAGAVGVITWRRVRFDTTSASPSVLLADSDQT